MSTPASSSANDSDCGTAMQVPGSSSQLQDFFRRLTVKKDYTIPALQTDDDVCPLDAPLDEQGHTSRSSKIPKAKLSALDRLKKLGSRKGKEKSSAPVFPPEEWGIEDNSRSSPHGQAMPTDGCAGGDGAEDDGYTMKDLPPTPSEGLGIRNDGVDEERAENMTLAKRIQQVLASLTSSLPTQAPWPASTFGLSPSPDVSLPQTSQATESAPEAVPTDPTLGTPLPSSPPTAGGLVQDKSLISLLSSATVMNGSLAKGKESVFSILDRLRFPLPGAFSTISTADAKGKGKGVAQESNTLEPVMEGSEDVMLYGPLEPRADSEVEIAESEIVSLCGEAEDEGTPTKPPENNEKEMMETPKEKPKEKLVWVPSSTKISVQATWWGYRIYLPPPVLRVLNNKSTEAAKRAALLTTALKWLLDHIPLNLLPPQVRPATALLRRLVPLLGYIGSFVAWSWSAVRTFDKGHGVILSATWLLPVALIPGSWEESEVPAGGHIVSVNPAHPVSLPGTSSSV